MFVAIVPAYNEEVRVGSVVRDLLPHVDRVVVVDDGSCDATGAVAESAGAYVLRHRINRGQGAALETGHEYARRVGATHVLHFDADGQFSATDIFKARQPLEHDTVDIVFGTRAHKDVHRMPWTKRYIIHPLARIVDRVFGGVRLSDAHNGFRLFNARALEVLRLSHRGMAHASEIPALVKKHELRYVEIPVSVIYHEYGQRMSGGIAVVRDLILGKFSR